MRVSDRSVRGGTISTNPTYQVVVLEMLLKAITVMPIV